MAFYCDETKKKCKIMKKVERQEEKMHRTGFTPYFPLSKPDQILSKTNKYILFFPTGFF